MSTKNKMINLSEIKKFRVHYTGKETESKIKSVDFHYNGESVVYNTDNTITVLTLGERISKFTITVSKYGAGKLKYFDSCNVVHTSTRENDNLRLLSIDPIEYIRYFPGHAAEVVSIDASRNLIISGSKDTSIRLWDHRHQAHVRMVRFESTPLVAFHPSFNLIAVAYNSSTIKTFLTSNFNKSVSEIPLGEVDGPEWTSLKFSADGSLLMITTNAASILIIDAISGSLKHNYRGKAGFVWINCLD